MVNIVVVGAVLSYVHNQDATSEKLPAVSFAFTLKDLAPSIVSVYTTAAGYKVTSVYVTEPFFAYQYGATSALVEEKVNEYEPVFVGDVGQPERLGAAGLVVSIIRVADLGEVSTFPAGSVALTLKVYVPPGVTPKVYGLVHTNQLGVPVSRLHSNVEPT